MVMAVRNTYVCSSGCALQLHCCILGAWLCSIMQTDRMFWKAGSGGARSRNIPSTRWHNSALAGFSPAPQAHSVTQPLFPAGPAHHGVFLLQFKSSGTRNEYHEVVSEAALACGPIRLPFPPMVPSSAPPAPRPHS